MIEGCRVSVLLTKDPQKSNNSPKLGFHAKKKTAFAAFTSRIKFIAHADKRHCSVTRSMPRLYVRLKLCSAFWWEKFPRTRSSAASAQQSIPAYSDSSPAPVWLLHAAAAPPCGCFWNYLCTAVGRDSCCSFSLQPGIVSFALSCCSRSMPVFFPVDRYRHLLPDCR